MKDVVESGTIPKGIRFVLFSDENNRLECMEAVSNVMLFSDGRTLFSSWPPGCFQKCGWLMRSDMCAECVYPLLFPLLFVCYLSILDTK